jgi:hypothetical protein
MLRIEAVDMPTCAFYEPPVIVFYALIVALAKLGTHQAEAILRGKLTWLCLKVA